MPRYPMTKFATICALGLLVPSLTACGGTGAQAETPQEKVVRASERLRGAWLLVDFVPEQRLEPVLASLLAVQLGRLTIIMDGTDLTARGVGVQANRHYTVDSAAADRFTATITDDMRVKYAVSGEFQGQEVVFTAETPPWRGSGRLRRAE